MVVWLIVEVGGMGIRVVENSDRMVAVGMAAAIVPGVVEAGRNGKF